MSDREHEEVSEIERDYEDGSDPAVLDLIDVPLVGPRPHQFQSENWLLDPGFYWVMRGRVGWKDLVALSESIHPLWENGQSSASGVNNRVHVDRAAQFHHSLQLIRVSSARLEVHRGYTGGGYRKRQLEVEFDFGGDSYRLRVTDPTYEKRYFAKGEGYYEVGESCMTVSLGEPFEGFSYKLVAAIIEREHA